MKFVEGIPSAGLCSLFKIYYYYYYYYPFVLEPFGNGRGKGGI